MNQLNSQESTEIQLALTQAQIQSCFPVMRQLRPHIVDEEKFVEQVQRQLREGYHLAYLEEGREVKACSGFRFLEFLAWGKVVYIDDLVADSAGQRKGYGSRLLKWVIGRAKEADCDEVHLDSGPQRHDAHRLYLNQRFKIIGYHFSLGLPVG
jgi:GNAT superfamily N-acetyltransferase